MNTVTEPFPVYRQSGGPARQSADGDPLNRRVAPKRAAKMAVRRSKAVDCRISSLKVLALTLLREIESLEMADADDSSHLDLQAEVRRFEAELIHNALIMTGGRQRRAARLLGMKVTTLNAKIGRYRINIANSGDEKYCLDNSEL
jgi:DNA-binding NtrC family response regulator